MTDYPNNIPAKLEIIKASEITPKEVRWLWYPYIPFGKVTLLQGDPGDGKSMGDVPRIELFARQKSAGWDVWGNEVESDIVFPPYSK